MFKIRPYFCRNLNISKNMLNFEIQVKTYVKTKYVKLIKMLSTLFKTKENNDYLNF